MKGFKKLILATAIIAASSSSFAMQAMDDESLSATTGQDGITLKMDVNMQGLDIKWVDRNGITLLQDPTTTFNHAGAVHISTIGINALGQVITIDAGGDAGDTTGKGQLRIGMSTTGLTTINLNNTVISVADADDVSGSVIGTANEANIITFGSSAQLVISAGMKTEILLGNHGATQHFLSATADLPSVSLTNMSIIDAVGGGSITLDNVGLTNVHSVTAIDVVGAGPGTGLKIDTTGTTIGELALEGIHLGTAASASIGDVYVSGITANNVITVTGH